MTITECRRAAVPLCLDEGGLSIRPEAHGVAHQLIKHRHKLKGNRWRRESALATERRWGRWRMRRCPPRGRAAKETIWQMLCGRS